MLIGAARPAFGESIEPKVITRIIEVVSLFLALSRTGSLFIFISAAHGRTQPAVVKLQILPGVMKVLNGARFSFLLVSMRQ